MQLNSAAAKRGLGCHFVMWDYLNFEATVLAYLEGVDFAGLLDDTKSVNKLIVALNAKIEALNQEFGDSESRLGRLYDALESGSTLVSLQERIERQERRRFEIVDEIKVREQELAGVQISLTDTAKVKGSVLELCRKMADLSGAERYQLRAQLATQIRRVVDRINVFPGGYLMPEAEYRAMLETQLKDWELEDDYSWMVRLGSRPLFRSDHCRVIVLDDAIFHFQMTEHGFIANQRAYRGGAPTSTGPG